MANVPTLRFPGFTEEWQKMRLDELLDFYSTNSLSWEQLEYENGGLYNLHYGLIHVGLPTLVDATAQSLPIIKGEFLPRNYELVKEGDIAFADASEDTNEVAKAVEFTNTATNRIVCGLHTIHARDNKNRTVLGFKGFYFSSPAFHNQIRRLAQGTKIFSVLTKTLSECSVSLPTKDEQIKIASLLKLLDERIALQSKLIEDLKILKSAIVEMLYGQSTSKIRLGAVIKQVSIRNRNGSERKVMSVNNKYGFIAQSEQFEERLVASEDTSNYKVITTGVFAYNPARINVGSIAQYKGDRPCIVSPMYICFECGKQVIGGYLEHFFSTRYFHKEMEKRLEGSVRLCLSFEALCNISISLPPIEQQQKYAQVIGRISDRISTETGILQAYQKQKSYLLSAMFI